MTSSCLVLKFLVLCPHDIVQVYGVLLSERSVNLQMWAGHEERYFMQTPRTEQHLWHRD